MDQHRAAGNRTLRRVAGGAFDHSRSRVAVGADEQLIVPAVPLPAERAEPLLLERLDQRHRLELDRNAQDVPGGQRPAALEHLGERNLPGSQHRVGVEGADLIVAINGVKRQEISARVPYRQRQYYVLCLEQIAYARQHDKVTLIAYNSTGAPVTCTVFPISFVAGPRKTLLIE